MKQFDRIVHLEQFRVLNLAGHYTKQRFIASMEGAVLSGQYAAEAID